MPEPRLASEIWISAHIRTVELGGGAAFLARRGADGAGAILIKSVRLDRRPPEPTARALIRATLGDGRMGWAWLIGPDWAEEPAVDEKIARQSAFDEDLWVLEVEDREGRHFLQEPVA